MRIRMAKNAEGELIHELTQKSGYKILELDWSKIEPFWLVAETDEKIVGALQICFSLPVGRMEVLSVDPDIPFKLRALVVRDLIFAGAQSLRASGAQAAAGLVPFELKRYKQVLKNIGCVVHGSGNEMVKHLGLPVEHHSSVYYPEEAVSNGIKE